MLRMSALILVTLAVSIATAAAQTRDAPFAALADRLSIGDGITVTTGAGTTHTGTLQRLSDTSIVLRMKGTDLTLAAPDILRIARREHHIRHGMIIGLASGFLVGAVLAVRADDCTYTCFSSPAGVALWGGLGGGAGLAVGALVGAARPRASVVYELESRSARVAVTPEFGFGRAGVRFTW
jgi:hypothetical protein